MFRLSRNERSHWSGNGVHVEPESVFMIGRNMHQFLSTQLSIWKSGANFPHSGMPVQNELCGILIEDFLSIWKFRAVFLFGILVILFEGMMDSGVLKYGGADSYLSGILPLIFQDVSSRWAIPSSSSLVFSQVGITWLSNRQNRSLWLCSARWQSSWRMT